MKLPVLFPVVIAAVGFFGLVSPVQAGGGIGSPRLEIVAQMKERPGNIAVAADGRMFVSVHPFDSPMYRVLLVSPDGTSKPYPDAKWSAEPAGDGVGLAAVIHLKVMGDTLYILDMGNQRVQPKLVAWDTAKNKLDHVWYLPNHVNTAQSFHQDFVITPDRKNVFIADMGQVDIAAKADPAIVHLSLETGMARRLLANHPSLRPSAKPMVAAGQEMRLSREGKESTLYLGLNPIAMDPAGEWIYYAPMGQGLMYKVRVKDMIDPVLSADDLSAKLVVVGTKPPSDGILVDGLENIFIASVADGAIGVMNNKGKYSTWLRDPLLSWPDGLAFGPDNAIYLTVNQLHLAAMFNKGEDMSEPPYIIARIVGGRPLEKKK